MMRYSLVLSERLKDAPDIEALNTEEKVRHAERVLKEGTKDYFEKLRIAKLETLEQASTSFLG